MPYTGRVITSGSVVGRYEVGPEIGCGGMGRVYRAHDTRLDRDVAIKVVAVSDGLVEEARRRLLREAQAAAALDHPGAVGIYDVGELEGVPYIVMELVEGESLRVAMTRHEHGLRDRLRWLLEVARVLEAAHARGLVHRDIKPENVMLRPDGSIRVLDFGIARRRTKPVDESATTEDLAFATITEMGIPVGTPLYMAPEQIRGLPVDGRTDQFAWGVMAYEILSGRPPWAIGDSLQLVAAILTDAPTPLGELAEVPLGVSAIIERTLAKNPDRRFPTTGALVSALESVFTPGSEAPATPTPYRGEAPVDLTRYSAGELSEILERVLLRQPATDEGLDAGDLLELARGWGVDEATLEDVADDLSTVKSPRERREIARRALRQHVALWLAVTVFLFLINMLTSPTYPWFLFPFLGWGLGVAIQAIGYLFGGPPKPRARKLKRLMGRLGGERVRSGLSLEPTVRAMDAALRGAPSRASEPPSMDTAMEWDARFMARRIDSNLAKRDEAAAGARVADETEAAVEDAALDEMIREESELARRERG